MRSAVEHAACSAIGHESSVLHSKNNLHDTPHFTEPLRVEVVGDLDVFMVRPGDLESEACGCELNKSQAEVASVGIVIAGLNVPDSAVIVFNMSTRQYARLVAERFSRRCYAGATPLCEMEIPRVRLLLVTLSSVTVDVDREHRVGAGLAGSVHRRGEVCEQRGVELKRCPWRCRNW
jgi:hypothetical protein